MKSKIYTRIAMAFATILMFAFTANSQTTLSIKVTVAEDDVEEYRDPHVDDPTGKPAGYMDHGSSDLELCTENENRRQAIGIIFRNVQIPAGSTINSGFIQFTCDDDDNQEGPLPIDIWGIKEPNTSAPFTNDLFNCSSRPGTTAKVTWDCPVWAVKENRTDNEKTPDIKTLIQEIIDQAGWAAGNNMGFRLMNEEMGNIHREADAMDSGLEVAPELIVTFSAGGTGINSSRSELSSSVYPNPVEGTVYINNPSKDKFSYEIFAINGKLVSSRQDISGSTAEVDMSNFTKGVYFVKLISSEISETHKLIVK